MADQEHVAQPRALPDEPASEPARDRSLADTQRRLDKLITIGGALDAATDATSLAEVLLPHLVPSLADRAAIGRVDAIGQFVPWSWLARSGDEATPGVRLTAEDL